MTALFQLKHKSAKRADKFIIVPSVPICDKGKKCSGWQIFLQSKNRNKYNLFRHGFCVRNRCHKDSTYFVPVSFFVQTLL